MVIGLLDNMIKQQLVEHNQHNQSCSVTGLTGDTVLVKKIHKTNDEIIQNTFSR